MRGRALSFCLLGLGILGACNDHDPHPPNLTDPGFGGIGGGGAGGGGGGGTTNRDGGTGDAGGLDADAARECTDLDDPTTVVDGNAVSDDAPPLGGGALVDGTYDLTIAQKYVGAGGQAGPNGISYREVIRITGGTSLERLRIFQQNSGPAQTINATYVIQVASPDLTLTQQCPTLGTSEVFRYSLQDGKLTLTSAAGESFTYQARP